MKKVKKSSQVIPSTSGDPNAKRPGAKCSECSLRNGTYIKDSPPLVSVKSIVVGSRPVSGDCVDERAFSATAHWKFTGDKRFDKRHTLYTLAVPCYTKERLPEHDYEIARRKCSQGLLSCLAAEPKANVETCGPLAHLSVTGRKTLTPWLGAPTVVDGRQVIPNYDSLQLNGQPELGPAFWRWHKRLGQPVENPWKRLETSNDEASIAILASLASGDKPVAVDVETTGLSFVSSRLLCVAFADVDKGVSLSYPWSAEAEGLIRSILSSQTRPKVFHNAQFDLKSLAAHGYHVRGPIHDTMLLHAVIAPQVDHDLGWIFAYYFNAPRWKSERKGQEWADTPELRLYNARDTQSTALLLPLLLDDLQRVHNGWEQYVTFLQLIPVVCRMSTHGVWPNEAAMEAHRKYLDGVVEAATQEFARIVPKHESTGEPIAKLGKNGMGASMSAMFFDHYWIAPKSMSKKTFKPQLNDEMLASITNNPGAFLPAVVTMAQVVSKYRKATKLVSTYLDGMPIEQDGAIHPTWNIHSTGSRWRCSEPNLSNIPTKKNMQRDMRDIICARPGKILVEADYAQQELRIAAQLSHDKPLLEAYAQNQDVHKLNAIAAFGEKNYSKAVRNMAKTLAYSIIYEASEETMWRKAKLKLPGITLSQVASFARGYLRAHPELVKWHERIHAIAERERWVESAISGKRWIFHGEVDTNKLYNFPVQTFAGDLINRAIIKLDALCQLDERTRIIINCHDALILETSDLDHAITLLAHTMPQTVMYENTAMTYAIDFSYGEDWGHMVELPHEEIETYEAVAPANWDEQRTQVCGPTCTISFPAYTGLRRRSVLRKE